jgi:aminopeptidase N
MKTTITFIFLCFSCFLHGQVTFNPNDLNIIAKGDRDRHQNKRIQKQPESTTNYDVKWYRCCWNIDPNIDSISGNITTLFIPVQTDIDSLVLDLSQALTVDSVIYHNIILPWIHTADLLTIRFPNSLSHLAIDSVSVYYHGKPLANGFGYFVQSSHIGVPIIWTLSEPYGASDWWPCKNGLTDKADSVDIFIRTPAAYKAASNGILVSSDIKGQDIVYHWKHRYPIATYLVCLGVTNYAVFTQQVSFGAETLNVVNYVYPEDSVSASLETAIVGSMIQVYDTLFGIYPFQQEKYGHAQFGWGGGMEHQTITFVVSFGFELLAHELGHQWFGDKITCGSWSDIWLNEGFATYLSGLIYEHIAPEYLLRFRQVRIASITSKPDGSVFCTDTTDINRIFDTRLSYAKGAMVLHQLRWIMGDSAFFSAIRNYLQDDNLAYGFARTKDLKSHLESSWGQDLSWYFDEWYTGEGYPSYQINWAQVGDTVSLTVNQTQSHLSVTFFELPIPVKFTNSIHDTIILFSNTFSGESFKVVLPFRVDSVIFDPEYQLISGNNSVNSVPGHTLQNSLQVYPNPASNWINFRFNKLLAKESGTISIYDYSGRKIEERWFPSGENLIIINTQGYLPGLYFYLLTLRDFRTSGKFSILK